MILQGDSEKQKHLYYEFDRGQEPVGRGGMGVVYRGRMVDETTGAFRDVAIKEVQPEGDAATRKIVLDRARREASIQIRSDAIVEMLGFVETSVIRSDIHAVAVWAHNARHPPDSRHAGLRPRMEPAGYFRHSYQWQ